MIEEEVTVYHNIGDPNDTIYDHKIKLRYFKVTDIIELHIDDKYVISFDDMYIDDVLALFQRFNNIVYPRHEQN
jgi:hypothetical protein